MTPIGLTQKQVKDEVEIEDNEDDEMEVEDDPMSYNATVNGMELY